MKADLATVASKSPSCQQRRTMHYSLRRSSGKWVANQLLGEPSFQKCFLLEIDICYGYGFSFLVHMTSARATILKTVKCMIHGHEITHT